MMSYSAGAQAIKGQWKGIFIDKSVSYGNWGGEKCDYVLELESDNNQITGFSYTYFSENGKKYFTICRLEGNFDKKQKYLEIHEVERIKTNVPQNINNCFQVHKLTYFKKGSEETLTGDWIPAPNQKKNCGFGTTSLTRRILDNSFLKAADGKNNNNSISRTTPVEKTTTTTNTEKLNGKNRASSNNKAQDKTTAAEVHGSVSSNDVADNKEKKSEPKISAPNSEPLASHEKRNNKLLKSIEVENTTIKIDLYDNGEVDGDSISLFLNGQLLVSKKKLSEKPITLNIKLDKEVEEYDLEMYAENLGSIPPNTAVMIVTDGKKRYEVRMTSDLDNSGVIRFRKKA
jgi:hypothetical protein